METVDLLVILGPTASGKTALALDIARSFNGEIIAADSRTVYKGIDIATAKPTREEQALVPHHLLDVVSPDEPFSAAQFKERANKAICDIQKRNKLPILVGGTGLYIDSVVYDFHFSGPADPAFRAALEQKTIEDLQTLIMQQNLPMPENAKNKRYLIRALERGHDVPAKKDMKPGTLMVGILPERDILRQRIKARVQAMVKAGLIDEIQCVARAYGWDAPSLQTPGFKAFRLMSEGILTETEACVAFAANDWQLARRQMTWFHRHDDDIHWFSDPDSAQQYIESRLKKL